MYQQCLICGVEAKGPDFLTCGHPQCVREAKNRIEDEGVLLNQLDELKKKYKSCTDELDGYRKKITQIKKIILES